MKVLLMYEYPPSPSGLATQGDLLYKGLLALGVETFPVHLESEAEKTWYYRWFKPDIAVGIGYWGYAPQIVQDPQKHGILPVPWLVADGYIANYKKMLNGLPLILVTSNWVKQVYVRDGICEEIIDVLPVGCDTDKFFPRPMDDPQVVAIRATLGINPDQLMILTAGGDAASKGAQEVLQALAQVNLKETDWRYVAKVWPQPRTFEQNEMDRQLASRLGIGDRYHVVTDIVSRNFMPYLFQACDVYAAPSRLEGFGMAQVEAGACGKPVVGIRAMGLLDTMLHGETAFLADVAVENTIREAILGTESGFEPGHRIEFNPPRIADYRADVGDLAHYLTILMKDADLRRRMGEAARQRAVEHYDYRVIARMFVNIIRTRLGID